MLHDDRGRFRILTKVRVNRTALSRQLAGTLAKITCTRSAGPDNRTGKLFSYVDLESRRESLTDDKLIAAGHRP
jgi:hypothetical protein